MKKDDFEKVTPTENTTNVELNENVAEVENNLEEAPNTPEVEKVCVFKKAWNSVKNACGKVASGTKNIVNKITKKSNEEQEDCTEEGAEVKQAVVSECAVCDKADTEECDTCKKVDEEEEGEVKVLYKQMSPLQMVLRRFFRSRLSLVGLIMLLTLFIFSFLGPVIFNACGYNWKETTVDRTPTLEKTTTLKEYTYIDEFGNEQTGEVWQIIEKEVDINLKAPPSKTHWLGTDEMGMDVFMRLMCGGRISLTLGFVVVILQTIIGIIMGGMAGYFGKWVDQVIMRLVDILNCIPTLPILLIASAVLESWNIDPKMNIYYLMVILTIFSWSGTARMVRGQILYLREQEYIVACEVMGTPIWRRIFKHLIPNIMPQLIVSMTLGLGSIILYESTLSYLGLGIPLPFAAWGTMISSSTDPILLASYPNLWIPAGVLIVIAVLGFNFVGDGLRDAMDPKAKR